LPCAAHLFSHWSDPTRARLGLLAGPTRLWAIWPCDRSATLTWGPEVSVVVFYAATTPPRKSKLPNGNSEFRSLPPDAPRPYIVRPTPPSFPFTIDTEREEEKKNLSAARNINLGLALGGGSREIRNSRYRRRPVPVFGSEACAGLLRGWSWHWPAVLTS
jgi:hypothetical protein